MRDPTQQAARDLSEKLGAIGRAIYTEGSHIEALVMQAHRDGFNEACDRMRLPEADTPMERIARAGGNVVTL